jgi:hypothetical protein
LKKIRPKIQLFPVSDNGKWGFIDHRGQLAIPMTYDYAGFFYDGLAEVKIREKHAYINMKGDVVFKVGSDYNIEKYHEGMARITSGGIGTGKAGFIDKKGKVAIKPRFDHAQYFSDGFALVSMDKNKGYIDKKGEMKIILTGIAGKTNGEADSFSEGLAGIEFDQRISRWYSHRYGYINKKGKIIVQPGFERAGKFSEGLAAVTIYGYRRKMEFRDGYIDKYGSVVIDPVFNEAKRFSDGLAAVKIGKKWGYINKKGKIVIKPWFDYARSFSEGVAAVRCGEQWGFIDRSAKWIAEPKYAGFYPFRNGLAKVYKWDYQTNKSIKYGYINKNGKYVWELRNISDGDDIQAEALLAAIFGDTALNSLNY